MIFLVDNGSVRPEAYKNLCSVAWQVSQSIGEEVLPAPLLHANKISPDLLHGQPAKILLDLMGERYDVGERQFTMIPLFFGASGALVDYLPARLKILSNDRPGFQVRVLKPLFQSREDGGEELVDILEEKVTGLIEENGLEACQIVLVDHGSPKREVTAVRNELASLLKQRLDHRKLDVVPASMERRSGGKYDFNEPLLKAILSNPPFNSGNTVVAQLFLSPGRHAGPDGDIAAICKECETLNSGLKTFRTDPIGSHPLVTKILGRRWHERASEPLIHY